MAPQHSTSNVGGDTFRDNSVSNNEQRLYDVPCYGNITMSPNKNGQFRPLYSKKCIKSARKVRKPCRVTK